MGSPALGTGPPCLGRRLRGSPIPGCWCLVPLPHLPKFLRLICSPGDPYPCAFSLKKQKTQNVLNQLRVARAALSFSPARSDSPSQEALPLLLLPKLQNVLKGCFRVCPFESPLWVTFFFFSPNSFTEIEFAVQTFRPCNTHTWAPGASSLGGATPTCLYFQNIPLSAKESHSQPVSSPLPRRW